MTNDERASGGQPSEAAIAAWARLVRAELACLAAVESDLKSAGFPPLAWYDVLLELGTAPTHKLRPFEIEQRVLLKQYNLSRLIDRLEADGLVEREPCDGDARGRYVRITATGKALRRRMWPSYAEAINKNFASKLTSDEAATLARLLDKLINKNQ